MLEVISDCILEFYPVQFADPVMNIDGVPFCEWKIGVVVGLRSESNFFSPPSVIRRTKKNVLSQIIKKKTMETK